jgi:hypothetical protein
MSLLNSETGTAPAHRSARIGVVRSTERFTVVEQKPAIRQIEGCDAHRQTFP